MIKGRHTGTLLCMTLLIGCARKDPVPSLRALEATDPPLALPNEEPANVALVALIANGAKWNGKRVRVVGYCSLRFEETVLYPHREDFDHRIFENGVWLRLGWPVPEKYGLLGGGYVSVVGVFDSESKGHMGGFSGELRDISQMDRYPPGPTKRTAPAEPSQ